MTACFFFDIRRFVCYLIVHGVISLPAFESLSGETCLKEI